MQHLWWWVLATLGVFPVFFTSPSDALVMLTKDSTVIGKIVIVSPQAGDLPTANGTALINALSQIAATPTEPYVLKLGPGIYDVQDTSVLMKEYVDIEGSGEKITKITGAISSETSSPTSGTVQGANNAELRYLTVENVGAGTNTVAIYNSSSSPSILHVTATAMSGTNNYGVYCSDSSPKIVDATATAEGGTGENAGLYNSRGYPVLTNVYTRGSSSLIGGVSYGVYNDLYQLTMTNVTVSAGGESSNSYAVYNSDGAVMISHSVIEALNVMVFNGTTALTSVTYTQLKGVAMDNTAGTLTCKFNFFPFGLFDENCAPLP